MSAGNLVLPTVQQPFELDLSGFMTQLNSIHTQMQNLGSNNSGFGQATQGMVQNIKQLGDQYTNTTNNIVTNIKTMTAAEMQHQQQMQASAQAAQQLLAAQRAGYQQVAQAAQQSFSAQQTAQRAADAQALAATKAGYQAQLEAQRAYDQQMLANVRAANQAALNEQRAMLRQQQQDQQNNGFLSGVGRGLTGGAFGGGIAFGAGTVIGRAVIDDIAKGFDAWKNSVIGLNASLEQSQLAFTALTGSAGQAQAIVQGLENVAQHSVFGLPQLQQAAQQLLAYGASATTVVNEVQAIGTAAATAGGDLQDKFGRIGYVIAELNSGIPVSARMLNELGRAGVNLKPLAEQLGLTVAQLHEVGKTGEVSGQEVVDAFTKVYGEGGKFGDFMKQQTQTFSGSVQLIKTNVSLLTAQAFEPLFNVVRNLSVAIGNFVQSDRFAVWAANVKADIQAVIDVVGKLFDKLGSVAGPLGQVLGLGTGGMGQAGADPSASVKDTTTATYGYSEATAIAASRQEVLNGQLKAYKDSAKEAQNQIDDLTPSIEANTKALDEVRNQIDAVTNGFEKAARPIQDTIDSINKLKPDDIARKTRGLELTRAQIQIELIKPDTGPIDAAIKQLQDSGQDIGKHTLDGFNKAIDDVSEKIKALEMETPTALDARITALQDKMARLGLGATTAIDIQIATLRQQMADLDQATSQQIKSLQDIINAPALNVSGYSSAEASLAEQIRQGGGVGANVDALRQQYGEVARQKQAAINTDYQSREAAKTQLQQLQEYVDTQKTGDQAHMQELEAQKAVIEANNKAVKDGYDAQLLDLNAQKKAWEDDHKSRLDKLKLELDSQEQGKKKQQEIDAAAKEANNESIEKLKNQKDLMEAPYKSAKMWVDEQIRVNNLLQQASDVQRSLDRLPFEQQLQDLKEKEKDALVPLQDQEKSLTAAGRLLQANKQHWEDIKKLADDAAKKIEEATKAQKDQAGESKWVGAAPTAPLGGEGELGTVVPMNPFVKSLQQLSDWIDQHGDAVKAGMLGMALGIGAFALATTVAMLANPVGLAAAIIAISIAVDVYLQKYKPVRDAEIWSFGLLWLPILGAAEALHDAQKFTDWFGDTFGPGGSMERAIKNFGGAISDVLSSTGTVPTIIRNLVDLTLAPVFDMGGKIDTMFNGFKTNILNPLFGPGGLIDVLFGSGGAVHASLVNLESLFSALFDPGKSLDQKIKAVGTFFEDTFGAQGTIAKVIGALGGVLQGAFNTALTPLNAFMGGLVGAIRTVQGWFGITQSKPWEDIRLGGGGGGSGDNTPSGSWATGGGGAGGNKFAQGTANFRGGPAIFGEAGRELVHQPSAGWSVADKPTYGFLEKGATVIPNNLTESLLKAGVPGFAGGLLGEALATIGSGIFKLAGDAAGKPLNWLTDTALGKIPGLTLPGELSGVGTGLVDMAKKGMTDFIAGLFGRSSAVAGRATSGGGGHFLDLTFDAFRKWMDAIGGPLDTQDVWSDLISIGKERNVDPRWLLAVAGQESSYGTNAGRLGGFDNFIGMGMNGRGYAFDSGIGATDSSMHFAGYHSLHDMFEDLAMWIAANGTSFVSYDGSGVAKNQLYQQILAATAPLGVVGGDQSSGVANVEGMPGTQLLNLAMSDLAGTFGACEQYVGDVMQLAGLRYKRAYSAEVHSHLQDLNPGRGPLGAITFFPDISGDGHVGFSMGDDANIWGTIRGGLGQSQVGQLNTTGWTPYGWTDNPMYGGGYITEPVYGRGAWSGESYSFAEEGIERVMRGAGGNMQTDSTQPKVTIVMQPGAVQVDRNGNATVDRNKIVASMMATGNTPRR